MQYEAIVYLPVAVAIRDGKVIDLTIDEQGMPWTEEDDIWWEGEAYPEGEWISLSAAPDVRRRAVDALHTLLEQANRARKEGT